MSNSDHNQGRHPGQAPGNYQQRPPLQQPNPAAVQGYDPRLGHPAYGLPYPVPGMMPQQPGAVDPGTPVYPPMPQMPAPGAPAGYAQPQQGMAPAMPMAGGDYYYPQGQQPLPEVPAFAMPPGMQPHVAREFAPQQPAHAGGYDAGAPAYHNSPADYAAHAEAGVHAAADYGQAASDHGAVQQISQRLAQLQSQYEQEMAQAGRPGAHQGYRASDGHGSTYADPGQYHPQQGYAPQGYPQQEPVYAPAVHQPAVQGSVDHGGYYDQTAGYAPQGYEHQQAYHAQHGSHGGPDNAVNYQQEGHAPYAAGTVIAHHEASGGSGRKLAMVGAFIGALAIGGGAAYTYKFTDILGNRSGDVAAPVVKAVAAPVKVVNERNAEKRDSEDRALHDRLSGSGGAAMAAGDRMAAAPDVEPRKVAAAATGMLPAADKDSGGAEAGVPRRVKTLIVRPDGSIVQPSDKPETLPDSASQQEGATEAASELAASPPAPAAKQTPVVARAAKVITGVSAEGASDSAAGKTAGKQGMASMVQRVKPEAEEKQVRTAAVSAKTAVSAGSGAGTPGDIGEPYVVQVTSRDSPTSALAAFADLQQKYPTLIGSYEPDIERADLGDKGIWYRLRVGPVTGKIAAADLCTKLKAAGHAGCFVRRK